MTVVREFAPAKVNLTLHVTGQRDDGYHLLDSLVMFADVGDWVSVEASDSPAFDVTGPMADGVPHDHGNLVVQVADRMGVSARVTLEKHLPPAAGLGGGSSDAAATLRALAEVSGQPVPDDVLAFGADVPVCMTRRAARMQGVGELVASVPDLPALDAVLVNPRLPVLTAEVFKWLKNRSNLPMPADIPTGLDAHDLILWLKDMRNDLEAAAIDAEPTVGHVFDTLAATPGCLLARMSGSGGTCFGLYGDAETASSSAGRMQQDHPAWWVVSTRLNGLP